MGRNNSVYQAKLLAIRNSLKHLFTLPIYDGFCRINIFSDSVSSLKYIKDCETKNHIARDIQIKLCNYIEFFSLFTDVCFTWCKGHNNMLGNEIADFFAKDSFARTAFTNFPIENYRQKKSSEFWLERWSNTENGRITHNFIPGHVPSHILKNTLPHKVTQILTGHCRLNFFLNSIGRIIKPILVKKTLKPSITTSGFAHWKETTEYKH